jgi:hypothetical protein
MKNRLIIIVISVLIMAILTSAGQNDTKRVQDETLRQMLDLYYPAARVDSLMALERCAIGEDGAIVFTPDCRYVWHVRLRGKGTFTLIDLITEGTKDKGKKGR